MSNPASTSISLKQTSTFSLVLAIVLLFGVTGGQQVAHGQYKAPEWSKEATWYQIFPERFLNGDTANDPTAEYIGAPDMWEITPWNGDWYQRSFWEQRIGPQFTDFVHMRRYGGDLQGIIERLEYLENELAVNAIYLNSIFESRSAHNFNIAAYRHVDRHLGPNPKKDAEIINSEDPADPSTWKWTTADSLFLELIRRAHQRDIKIILDGIFNHTGKQFWAFEDVRENQQKSPYTGWYDIKAFDDPATEDTNEFSYRKYGNTELPEFKEEDGTLPEPVRTHIFAVTKRWMDPDNDGDPSDGVDGWKLEAAASVGMPFWEQWHEVVRDINENAYTSVGVPSDTASRFVTEGPFTGVVNYQFAETVHEFLIQREISAAQFDQKLTHIRENLPDSANLAVQNIIDNHTTPRVGSMVVNSDKDYNQNTLPSEGFKVRKPDVDEQEVVKLVAMMQFMYMGSPMVYYGTESGMWGADAPHNRKPMVWQNARYLPEVNHPLSEERPRDRNSFSWNHFIWYKNMALIRRDNKVFRSGFYETLVAPEQRDVFVFARYLPSGDVGIVMLNRTDKKQKIRINKTDLPIDQWQDQLYNPLNNGVKKIRSKEQISFELKPMQGNVWI